jgi:hypothetical protein
VGDGRGLTTALLGPVVGGTSAGAVAGTAAGIGLHDVLPVSLAGAAVGLALGLLTATLILGRRIALTQERQAATFTDAQRSLDELASNQRSFIKAADAERPVVQYISGPRVLSTGESPPLYFSDEIIAAFDQQAKRFTKEVGLSDSTTYARHEASIGERIGLRNIIGIGLGEKIAAGIGHYTHAIQLFVTRKVASELVEEEYLAANLLKRWDWPVREIDVVQIGQPKLFHHWSKSLRPLIPGGATVSDAAGKASGTLGAWLTDGSNEYLLTCWHCVGPESSSQQPVTVVHPVGGAALATVTASVDPSTTASGHATIDAALARVLSHDDVGPFVLSVGEIRGTRRVNASRVPVVKMGAKTHRTASGISNVSYHGKTVDTPRGSFVYDRQILIKQNPVNDNFADHGDSGAVVLTEDQIAVGLLVGGDAEEGFYLATPIDQVLNGLRRAGNLKQLRFITYP